VRGVFCFVAHARGREAARAMSDQKPQPPLGSAERSPLHFPPELPITGRIVDIATAINEHQVVIVAGATGSGKTTQLPKIALAMGRGVHKLIGVTQPRRLAATSVAARVASEVGSPLGTDVGYQIRFEDRTSAATYVKFMTDGILLAEAQGDALYNRYDTLIIDEAHERSLNIDFLLGWIKRILPKRPDLKVVISSATLETERFSAFFNGAPIISVEGRTFPVGVLYEPPDPDIDIGDAVADAVANVTSLDPRGDILVFLPGEREIRESEHAIHARNLRHTVVSPLYARLSAAEQGKVFSSIPERRVILATNVAETSLTIPGIVYVIDSGVARLSRYESRSGITRLQIEGISQASADQRKGRCGRVREGICIRLYDEQSFQSRVAYTDPEIKRTGLAGVILRMKSLGLGNVEEFPFLDPPASKAITEGYRVLEELGALGTDRELTPLGMKLARFPLDPRIGRMILAGSENGALRDVLVVAAALTIQDPRERPRDHVQKADALHLKFKDERSDFLGLLRLWAFVKEAEKKGTSQLRRTCKENFLNFIRIREWGEIHKQLLETTRELAIETPKTSESVDADGLHQALLLGLLSKIGQWNPEHRIYLGAKQTRFAIHPSSGLAKKPPAWIMAFELFETTQLFARVSAKIEPEWLLTSAPHLLRRSYSPPHWSEKSARGSIKENATLFGLTVFRDRSVSYASIDLPAARLMFIDHALVRGEYHSRGSFQAKNQKLLAEVSRLRDKARQSDMLADEDALLAFFDKLLPADVADGKSFETWREKAEAGRPNLLSLTLQDVLTSDSRLQPEDYPDSLILHGTKVDVSYAFNPAAENDGITLTIPLALLPQLTQGELDWTIPGWHKDKLLAILYELSRAQRRDLGSIPELADALAKDLVPFRGSLSMALSKSIQTLTGAVIPEEAFRTHTVATYLRLTCRIVDEQGKVLLESRDVSEVLTRYGAKARAALKTAVLGTNLERAGLRAWSFGDLPEYVTRQSGLSEVRSYPALVDNGASVDLKLLESAGAAEIATRGGLRRLLELSAKSALRGVEDGLPGAYPKAHGGAVSGAETDAFRSVLFARIIDEAFELKEGQAIPRSLQAFDACMAKGAPRVANFVKAFVVPVKLAATELLKTLQVLKSAEKHPSGTLASKEMRVQLEHLFPADLLAWIPLAQLSHYPRYLRAIQARLGRAITDPQKDAGKLAPFTPAWSAFLAKRPTVVRDKEAAAALRWDFEELRVALFAPELKTPYSVTTERLAKAVTALK
jgi:ATP-dependent helicase HrpA